MLHLELSAFTRAAIIVFCIAAILTLVHIVISFDLDMKWIIRAWLAGGTATMLLTAMTIDTFSRARLLVRAYRRKRKTR